MGGYTPEKNKEYLRKRYHDQRRQFIDYLGGKCQECGTTESLHFHHRDPLLKSFGIGRLWPSRLLPNVFEELDKCDLLCSSHHQNYTNKQSRDRMLQRGWRHGTIYAWMKKKCTCNPCSNAKRQWHTLRNLRRRKGYPRLL